MERFHQPVLTSAVLRLLAPEAGGVYVDATLGGAGHAQAICQRLGPSGTLIGLDRDADALAEAGRRLQDAGCRVSLVRANFRDIKGKVRELGFPGVNGILFDLGVSSHQLDSPARGFSYQHDGPLDMRMDRDGGARAADLVNNIAERELAQIIRSYGEERWAARIAAAIVARRARSPITGSAELAAIIKDAIPAAARRTGKHPARKTFQALRIAVNDELGNLKLALSDSIDLLQEQGRIVIIAYHSLEDRIVKRFFLEQLGACRCPPGLPRCSCGRQALLRLLTKKPVTPEAWEVEANPRARSARLRAAEKLKRCSNEEGR